MLGIGEKECVVCAGIIRVNKEYFSDAKGQPICCTCGEGIYIGPGAISVQVPQEAHKAAGG